MIDEHVYVIRRRDPRDPGSRNDVFDASGRDPRERKVAIVSLGRGTLWAYLSIVMYPIHVGEYGSRLDHAQ